MPGNIVLIGFMGSGKSTSGRILAADLGWDFIDTDILIATETGLPIKEIFALHGEAYFRALEQEAVARAAAARRAVIATGGGAVLSTLNVQRLRKGNKVIWLQVELPAVMERTGAAADRPLLQGQKQEDIAGLWQRRKKFYQFADVWLATGAREPAEVAAAIKEAIQQWLAELK